MLTFTTSFYVVKGKIPAGDFDGTTFLGIEADRELETKEKEIIPAIEKLLKGNPEMNFKGFRWQVPQTEKEIKAKKKAMFKNVTSIYFVEIENAKWLESGSFKVEPKFIIKKSLLNSYEFKKIGIDSAKADAKELARPDKDE